MGMIYGNMGLIPTYQPNISSIKTESQDKVKLKEACKQFESIFINYLLKSMRATVPDGGLFQKGVAYDIVLSMHARDRAAGISLIGGIGRTERRGEVLS